MTNFDTTFFTITARGEWISKARSRPNRPGSPTLSLTSLNESRLAVKTKNPIPPAVADIFQLILTLAEVWGEGGGNQILIRDRTVMSRTTTPENKLSIQLFQINGKQSRDPRRLERKMTH